jgi:hypothetical protein
VYPANSADDREEVRNREEKERHDKNETGRNGGVEEGASR